MDAGRLDAGAVNAARAVGGIVYHYPRTSVPGP
jgi:hypothetical protein